MITGLDWFSMPRAVYAEWDEEDATDWVDEPQSRRLRRKPLSWLRVALMSSCCIAGLVYFALDQEQAIRPAERPNGVPASVMIAPAPAWKPVPAGNPAYALANASGAVTSEARQHTGGAREDTLTLGRFGDARHAQIALVQGPAEPVGTLYVDTVRRAARAGLAVAHQGQSRMIATKFGPVETAPMTLSGQREQECRAFRFSDATAEFGFQGWLCSPSSDDEAQLACFIDGIALAGNPSPSLKAIFARTERSRMEACGPGARTASAAVKAPTRP